MEKITIEQLDSLIKSAVNSSGPLPHDEKFSQIISALRELRTHRNLINERGNFSTPTNNHPAHGPVSLDRLHRIREILSKVAAQSDGGNLVYAMADAVKVIDGVIAAFGAEPVAWQIHTPQTGVTYVETNHQSVENIRNGFGIKVEITPLHRHAQPAPVVPDIDTIALNTARNVMCDINRMEGWPGGDVQLLAHIQSRIEQACRAAMLQDGNSPVTPDCWIPVSERMPERDVDVQVYCADKKEQMVGYMERNETEGWFRFASLPNGGGVYCKPTHWMSLPAAPQQAKSQHKKK